MLPIDGAMGEGGGQPVRSAVTERAVTIDRIRERRKEGGLAARHVAGTGQAGCDGLVRGSRRLTFEPGPMAAADLRVDVGTAGSIPLVIHTGGPLSVTGGTEVAMSPTIGRLGYPAEAVGRDAARRLLKMQAGGGTVDVHLADPLLIDLDCNGGTGTAGPLTTHAATVRDLLDMPVSVAGGDSVVFSA